MKSGPTLNGCTARPRRRRAASRARVTVVLPAPLWVPATISRRAAMSPPAGSAERAAGDGEPAHHHHRADHADQEGPAGGVHVLGRVKQGPDRHEQAQHAVEEVVLEGDDVEPEVANE